MNGVAGREVLAMHKLARRIGRVWPHSVRFDRYNNIFTSTYAKWGEP